MKTLAIIQARVHSSRFPFKIFETLRGTTLLAHVIQRVQLACSVDRLVVAIPFGDVAAFRASATYHTVPVGIEYVAPRGVAETDVLRRLARIAQRYRDVDYIVRVCGDNPLVEPSGIDALIDAARRTRADYAAYELAPGVPAISRPTGWFAEVMLHDALLELNNRLSVRDPRREHVTQAIYEDPDRYGITWLPVPSWWRHVRNVNAAIDTPADLERVRAYLNSRHPGPGNCYGSHPITVHTA